MENRADVISVKSPPVSKGPTVLSDGDVASESQEEYGTQSRCSSEERSSVLPLKQQQRFYFESDILALKNNTDYQKLLKTLAVLEAQKIQTIKDLECLVQIQVKAEKDPLKFVDSLRKGTLQPLPKRQVVVEIPDIEWKGYIDSLQTVARQHSSLYINTRRKSRPLISSLEEKPVAIASSSKIKDANRPASYRQPWTAEEQARFEELLKIYPPEPVERKRFQKIAKALGTRTTQQVATHVQKYFIKLAHAGLPVPGRMPNLTKYTKKRKGKGKRGGLKRPSTFFSSLTPRVFMGDRASTSGSQTPAGSVDGSCYDESSDDNLSEVSDINSNELVAGEDDSSGLVMSVKCSSCGAEQSLGASWQCTDCPEAHPTQLCSDCVNSDYRSSHHLPSHDLQLSSFGQSAAGGDINGTSSLLDKDYTLFDSRTSSKQTSYNYLDPNFYPAF